jgi:hypothetical protein
MRRFQRRSHPKQLTANPSVSLMMSVHVRLMSSTDGHAVGDWPMTMNERTTRIEDVRREDVLDRVGHVHDKKEPFDRTHNVRKKP